MPVPLTHPGVFIEEVASGVHTFLGIATSIAAFVGSAIRGPMNEAVQLNSLTDYERCLGGLAVDSEMGYAVHQFFQNGGTDAYAVRLAKDATFAERTLWSVAGTELLKVRGCRGQRHRGASGSPCAKPRKQIRHRFPARRG